MMSSYWERLLSAAPETTSWPQGFVAATEPLVSPRRVFKKSRVLATSGSAGRIQTVPIKRRPSVLGGGFSTAGLSSPAISSCPWGENNLTASSGCWQELDGSLKKPGRRRSCAESPSDDDDDDDDDKPTTDVSVVGWGDRHRRRSSRRPSQGDMAEWQDGRPRRLSTQGVVLAAAVPAVAISQQQQQQQRQQQRHETQEDSEGCMSSDGRGKTPSERGNSAADATTASYFDIVSRETTAGAGRYDRTKKKQWALYRSNPAGISCRRPSVRCVKLTVAKTWGVPVQLSVQT